MTKAKARKRVGGRPPIGGSILNVRLTDALRAKLERAVAESGRSKAEEVRRALDRGLAAA